MRPVRPDEPIPTPQHLKDHGEEEDRCDLRQDPPEYAYRCLQINAMSRAEETVFIIDDDPSVRKSLIRLIRSAGLNVEGFKTSGEFLERLPFSGRGCAILDLNLPDISGLELCRQITMRSQSLPVIFLTGRNDSGLRPKAAGNGIDCIGFFTKPVDSTKLLNAVRLALDRCIPQQTVSPTAHRLDLV